MQTLDLFDDIVVDAPATEGIKYAGSKVRLLPQILQLTKKVRPTSVFDAFSGTTRVSQAFAQSGYRVIANDISVWSRVLATCYLLNEHEMAHYDPLIRHLNTLPPRDGWFTQHYGGDVERLASPKMPWQKHVTRRLDAIREEIDRMSLPDVERAVVLTSLMLALDRVDSTLGHFASYLNGWSNRSFNELKLTVPRLDPAQRAHEVFQDDALQLAGNVDADLAYFDPPYGSNNEKMPPSRVRYAAYYHVWTTICLNDKPELFGKVNRRSDSSDVVAASVFEEFRKTADGRFIVAEAIERLLHLTRARHIILSYSSGGRATAQELNRVIENAGKLLEVIEVDHRRHVMASMRWTNDWVRVADAPNKEFLFLIRK